MLFIFPIKPIFCVFRRVQGDSAYRNPQLHMLNVSEGFHIGIILCFSRINVEYVFGDIEITEGLSNIRSSHERDFQFANEDS